jgi:hypothetical protein
MEAHELKEQIELLIDLQEKERAIARIEQELVRIPEKLDAMRIALAEIEGRMQEFEERLGGLRKAYREQEGEVQSHQSRVQKREGQLRSVKTNQEYRAILKEIADIKAATSQIEDDMLKSLEDAEAAEAAMKEASAEYERENKRIEEEGKALEEAAEARRREQEALRADCEALTPHIDARMLKKYRFAREQAGVLAVVPAKNGTCTGCNMNIPPQLFNELYRWDELRFCPHCHRILYVI